MKLRGHHTLLCAVVLASMCVCGSRAEAREVNYIYRGDFSGVTYAHGQRLQRHWMLWPFQDTSGFKVERGEEAAVNQEYLRITYPTSPKSPDGWNNLLCQVDFMGIPQSNTIVSFRARGEGYISASVNEYALRYTGKGYHDGSELDYLGNRGSLKKSALTKEWQTFSIEYTPSGPRTLGLVQLAIAFLPSDAGSVNVMLDDVKATSRVASAPNFDKTVSQFTIPQLPHPPVIDGKVGDSEWNQAVRLSCFTDMGIFTPPSSGLASVRVGYDANALYVALRAEDGDNPVAEERPRDQPVWDDDSLEILLASPEDAKQRAHFILSARNCVYDADYKSPNPNTWNPDWQHAVASDGKSWTAEAAIPWSILGWKVSPGQSIRMNMGHNNSIVTSEKKVTNISCWSIATVAGKAASFDLIEAYPIARLATNGIAAGTTLRYDPATFTPMLELAGVNASGQPTELLCAYGTDDGLAGRMVIPSSGVTNVPLPTRLFGEDKKGHVTLQVRDKDNNLLYSHKEVFKEGFESAIEMRKYFPAGFVEIVLDITSLPRYQVAYQVTDISSAVADSKTVTCDGGGMNKIRVDVTKWKTETPYSVHVEVQDLQGMKLAEQDFKVTRPGKEPWDGTTAGITDQPLPPYKPIVVESTKLKPILREYEYGKRVLPVSIKSEGKELLAGPVDLTIISSGKTASLAASPRRVTSRKPNCVKWKASGVMNGLKTEWSCWMEEDGFSWHQVTLTADRPVKVDRLLLTVPVKKQYAKLVSAMPSALTGDMEGHFVLGPKGWKSIDHKQVLDLMDNERGVEICTEDTRYWSNIEQDRGQSIVVLGDRAEMRTAFVDKPTVFRGKRVYAFGIQAFPEKPYTNSITQRSVAHAISYSDAAISDCRQPAYIEYPVKGNLDVRQGTLEAQIYTGFDPKHMYPDPVYQWMSSQRFLYLKLGECTATLEWNPRYNGWHFSAYSNNNPTIHLQPKTLLPWRQGEWHHLALTWGDTVRLLADGEVVAESKAEGFFGVPVKDVPEAKDETFLLGKKDYAYFSAYRLAGVRVSSRALPTSEMAMKDSFSKTGDTLLLDDFAACAPGKEMSAPQAGTRAGITGDAELTSFDGRTVLSMGPIPSPTRIDPLPDMGIRTVVYHCHQAEAIDLPYFQTKERSNSMKTLVNELHSRGIKLLLGFSYGVGFTSREDNLYGDYWYAYPIHQWGNLNDPQAMNLFCVHCSLLTDYYIYYWQKLFDEYDIDGIYTDGTFVAGNQCINPYHGCGWTDDSGRVHPSGNLLAGRRFQKRLYAISHLRKRPVRHDMHSGWGNHAIFASWTDSYLCGEQYLAHATEKGWNIDLTQFRVQNVGKRFGMPSHAIGELVPFGYEGMWAVSLLHDVDTRPCAFWKRDQVSYAGDIWRLMARFDTDTAQFLPYWENSSIVITNQNERQYASLWLHKGRRALVVVSNLDWKDTSVPVMLNLEKLGLQGRSARNALTNEPVPIQNGSFTLPMTPYEMVLVWME